EVGDGLDLDPCLGIGAQASHDLRILHQLRLAAREGTQQLAVAQQDDAHLLRGSDQQASVDLLLLQVLEQRADVDKARQQALQDGGSGEQLVDGRDDLRGELDDVHAALATIRSEEHTSELQSRGHLVCRLLLEKKK